MLGVALRWMRPNPRFPGPGPGSGFARVGGFEFFSSLLFVFVLCRCYAVVSPPCVIPLCCFCYASIASVRSPHHASPRRASAPAMRPAPLLRVCSSRGAFVVASRCRRASALAVFASLSSLTCPLLCCVPASLLLRRACFSALCVRRPLRCVSAVLCAVRPPSSALCVRRPPLLCVCLSPPC